MWCDKLVLRHESCGSLPSCITEGRVGAYGKDVPLVGGSATPVTTGYCHQLLPLGTRYRNTAPLPPPTRYMNSVQHSGNYLYHSVLWPHCICRCFCDSNSRVYLPVEHNWLLSGWRVCWLCFVDVVGGAQSGTVTDVCPSAPVFPRQYHFINAPYWSASQWYLIWRGSGQSVGTLKHSIAVWDIEGPWIERNPFVVWRTYVH